MKDELMTESSKALDFAAEIGHLMLENGAEINRVEETMERISTHFGVDTKDFFVVSNAIFTTGNSFARVQNVAMKGSQLEKVIEASRLSRDVVAGKYTLEQAWVRLEEIKNIPMEKPWVQILASALGSAGFCAIFSGSLIDCGVSAVIGAILWAVIIILDRHRFSKVFCNMFGGALVAALCLTCIECGIGESLSHVLIGALIPLVPGVSFTNGIKDIANEDYIAGATRLIDSLLVFLCIAMGVSIVLITYGHITGGMITL